jgi:hypothetical protein
MHAKRHSALRPKTSLMIGRAARCEPLPIAATPSHSPLIISPLFRYRFMDEKATFQPAANPGFPGFSSNRRDAFTKRRNPGPSPWNKGMQKRLARLIFGETRL